MFRADVKLFFVFNTQGSFYKIWKASEDDYPESYIKNCLIYVLNSEKIKYVYYQSGSADLNSIYSLEYDLDDDDDVDGKDLYLLID